MPLAPVRAKAALTMQETLPVVLAHGMEAPLVLATKKSLAPPPNATVVVHLLVEDPTASACASDHAALILAAQISLAPPPNTTVVLVSIIMRLGEP